MALAAAVHFLVASHAASTKSATFDEPVHVGRALQWKYSDFRLNPEHPLYGNTSQAWQLATFP